MEVLPTNMEIQPANMKVLPANMEILPANMEILPGKQPLFTLDLVSEHCSETSCWIVVNDKVYDVTSFLNKHPGGEDVVLEHAGTDATVAFEDKGHSKYGVKLLEKYIIGELIEKDRRFKKIYKKEP